MADPVFSLFVQQQWAYTVGDWCVSASFATLCLLLIFHQQRFLIFRRLLFILALLNTLRSLAILFTRLPSSYDDNFEKCRPKVNGSERNAWLLLNRTMEQAIRLGLQVIPYSLDYSEFPPFSGQFPKNAVRRPVLLWPHRHDDHQRPLGSVLRPCAVATDQLLPQTVCTAWHSLPGFQPNPLLL